jgi:predicted MFS family arabinose efflux permease
MTTLSVPATEIPVIATSSVATPIVEDRVKPGGWFTFATILGLTLFAFVDRQVLTLVAAPMAAELRLSDGQLGLVLGLAFALFTLVAAYPIGWAADRFDRRIVLGLCVVIWSAGTAACGLAQNFSQLFVAAVAIAAGEAGLGPIAMSVIPDLFTGRKRVLANALNYIFAYLGVSVGLMLGGVAISQLDQAHATLPELWRQFSSWRLAFFLVSLPAPIFLGLIAFARLERPRRVSGGEVVTQDRLWPFLRLHARAISLVLGALVLYLLAFGGFMAWLPAANTRLFATSAAENGVGMGVAAAAGMVIGVALGTLLMRHLMVRSGRGSAASVRVAWIVALITTPVLFGFPFITAAWQGFALFGLLMVAGTAIGSLVPTMLQDMTPASIRARFLAVYTILAGLIGGSAPTAVGWISTLLGGTPHDLLAAMTLVALPCWLVSILLFRLSEHPFAELVRAVEQTTH